MVVVRLDRLAAALNHVPNPPTEHEVLEMRPAHKAALNFEMRPVHKAALNFEMRPAHKAAQRTKLL